MDLWDFYRNLQNFMGCLERFGDFCANFVNFVQFLKYLVVFAKIFCEFRDFSDFFGAF